MFGSDSREAEVAMARLEALAQCTDEPGRITRLAFSPALRDANALALAWMRGAGMVARQDAAGNVIGRYEGEQPDAPAILLGSHLDSVRDAGRFDGPLGVVAAIAVAERLHRGGRRLAHAIEAIGFADEEGVRFGGTVLGSAAVAGRLPAGWRDRQDADGIAAADALRAFGLDPDAVEAASRRESPPIAYLELHIEQGPRLEAAGAPLGCVTGIAGASRFALTARGETGEAGATPMALRRDALAAAAQCALAVERICTNASSAQDGVVGTVGRLVASPGASGAIAGGADFTLDIRAADDRLRLRIVDALRQAFRSIGASRNVEMGWRTLSETNATPCSDDLIATIAATLGAMGLPAMMLPSGAGHDGIAISAIAPIGMVFVRCAGGVSHNPAEHVAPADAAAGIEALHRLCLALSSAPGSRKLNRACV